jgi:RNA polymerase sigma-70 factor (ECF subfamily)
MDESTFQAFYDRTVRPLYAYLCRLSQDRSLAEDLVQESYLRLLKSNRMDDGDPRLTAYLFRTATNLFRDVWRRRQRETRLARWFVPSKEASACGASTVDTERALQRLRPVERAMLWLAYVCGFEHREIAAILGIRQNGIRVRLYRSRKKMARMLQDGGSVGETRDGPVRL